MRSHTLHVALRDHVEQAAWVLAGETADGAEVAFDLVEEGYGTRTPLYCYRPLVDDFLRDRALVLERLDTHSAALRALARHEGVERYLKVHGDRVPREPGARALAALEAFLGRVFADTTDFAFDAERFERVYAQLEEHLFAGRTHAAVLVPVLGLDIASPDVVLGEGLALTRVEAVEGGTPGEAAAQSDVMVTFRAEVRADSADPFAQAGRALKRLAGALVLYDEGTITLGPVAWTRADDGPWRPVTLGGGGARVHGLTLVEPEDEDELRAFCSLVARRMPRSGPVAWALARHGMALRQASGAEALTDVLLALRALLGDDALPERLAALCAVEGERDELRATVEQAVALERALIAGTPAGGADVASETLGDHLRALLRDVLCGHLDADLRAQADALLREDQPTLA